MVSTTPLSISTADIRADEDLRRFGPHPERHGRCVAEGLATLPGVLDEELRDWTERAVLQSDYSD